MIHPRQRLGSRLCGAVLEVGPGNDPFPTAEGARVTFADRSVPGGRDATWPELAGAPYGPEADMDVNLDSDGLRQIADESFDGVVASHVIEHVANPLSVLTEFERVLRLGGCLVLVVPDRGLTFDAPRPATPYAHVREEFDRGVTTVGEEHIKEFCAAIFGQPPIHPPEVRDWHNPAKLDAARLDLHRRRSIHVHCWAPEEFASLLACAIADGILSWRLRDVYFAEDLLESQSIEFGLALERAIDTDSACRASERFITDWCEQVLADVDRDPMHAAKLAATLERDLPSTGRCIAAALAADVLARYLTLARAEIRRVHDGHLGAGSRLQMGRNLLDRALARIRTPS